LGISKILIKRFGASNMHLGKIVTNMVKLLTDANQVVRDKAFETFVELYRHVGDRLRNELRKKQIQEAK
jgi:CLIP-associating protein 1/2